MLRQHCSRAALYQPQGVHGVSAARAGGDGLPHGYDAATAVSGAGQVPADLLWSDLDVPLASELVLDPGVDAVAADVRVRDAPVQEPLDRLPVDVPDASPELLPQSAVYRHAFP